MAQFRLKDCTLLIDVVMSKNYVRLYKHSVFGFSVRVKLYDDKPRTYRCSNYSAALSAFNSFTESLVKANPIL